jgi:hypothetical protein
VEDKVIETFNKNAREKVRVMLTTYQGRDLIDIRSCVEGDEGLVPTRKGITMSIELISKLRECLAKAAEELKK